MFTARITMQIGEVITKDEINGDDLAQLLTDIIAVYHDEKVLEIHITREEVKNENRNQG